MIGAMITRKEKIAIGVILLICIAMRLGLALRTEHLLYTKYFQEDAFYMFNCAEQLARGNGFSIDGIHPTNGVQPLIVVLYAPLFILSGFDKLLTLQFAFGYTAIVDSLTIVFFVLLLSSMKKQKKEAEETSIWYSPLVILSLLWATLHPIFVHTVSGLETGLLSMFIVLSLYLYSRILNRRNLGQNVPILQYLLLGVVLGFTVLSRIDAAIFVTMIALYEIYRCKAKGIISAGIISATALLVSSPWWYYNYTTFGSLIPQSGQSESIDPEFLRNISQTLGVLGDSLSVFFSVAKMIPINGLYYTAWFITISAIAIYVIRKWKVMDVIKRTYDIHVLMPLIGASCLLIIYYTFFFGAPHFMGRYLIPFRIVVLVLAAMCIPAIIKDMMTSRGKQLMLAVVCTAALLNSLLKYLPNYTTDGVSDFYLTGKWALTIPNARIGMYQSGTSGFIAPNVVNLDGKVNYEALKARQEAEIGKYVVEQNLEYVADHKIWVEQIVRSAEKYGGHYTLVDSIQSVFVYKRNP
jgi:hypothetical protein